MGIEPATPVFQRAKAVHASNVAATVVGFLHFNNYNYCDQVKGNEKNGRT
jgi:hypothetical protein